ncbi:Bromodomain-containing protein [Chytriomyces sp. MP71]|nr:Bromodomain-containing protein [Chytriomyces sp. MP71]
MASASEPPLSIKVPRRASSVSLAPTGTLDPVATHCIMLNALSAVINYVDSKGRFVAELFMELVPRRDYPDYYKIISKPVAIQTMLDRIEQNVYGTSIPTFEADFSLLVTNAMTYNQIGSEVYKDARTLLGVFQADLAKEIKLAETDSQAVKFKTIINKIYAHQEPTDGRYTWDVFFELPDRKLYKDYYIMIKNPIALNGILDRIDALGYKSLEAFTSDMMLMVKNAKTYNVEGSQIYIDADKLAVFFKQMIHQYVRTDLLVPTVASNVGPAPTAGEGDPLESLTIDSGVYRAGDYVYIANPVDPEKPTIAQITSIFKSTLDPLERPSFSALWFLRPQQTFQLATAKFYENEVLRTNRIETYLSVDIVGRCWVLYVKDYLRMRPKDASDMKHVYCCESRYQIEHKSTSKIKIWQQGKLPEPELVQHPELFIPARVALFKEEGGDAPVTSNKKRKSEAPDYNDSKDEDYHHDKKARTSVPQRPATSPGAGAVMNSSHSRRSATGMPSLSQQVASLALPGAKPAVPLSTGSGTSTPNAAAVASSASAIAAAAASALENAGALGPIFELFDRTPAGEVKWYAGLPVHVVQREVAVHSLAYRIAKMRERRKQAEAQGVKAERENDITTAAASAFVPAHQSDPPRVEPQGVEGGRVDLEAQLLNPIKRALYDLASAYLA